MLLEGVSEEDVEASWFMFRRFHESRLDAASGYGKAVE